ncbi:hypothetical protein D3C85_979310 [compost metagenome]
MRCITDTQREALGYARLHDIASLEITLPLLARSGRISVRAVTTGVTGAVDVALDIARHQGQARYPIGGHVDVIARLYGGFIRTIEVRVLRGVREIDRVSGIDAVHQDIVKGGVAVHLLMGQGEAVCAEPVGG